MKRVSLEGCEEIFTNVSHSLRVLIGFIESPPATRWF